MSKHRKEIALQVTRSLRASEVAIDSALAQVASFVAEMPAARQEARFAACVGQDALAQAIAALTALSTAREAMVKAHESLAEVRDQFQIPTGYGVPYEGKPDYPQRGSLLTVVSQATAA